MRNGDKTINKFDVNIFHICNVCSICLDFLYVMNLWKHLEFTQNGNHLLMNAFSTVNTEKAFLSKQT